MLITKSHHRYEQYENADVIVLSVGKSGRTWLRVLINKYLSLTFNIPFSLDDMGKGNEKVPSIVYTHEIAKHFEKSLWQRINSSRLMIPDHILMNKKVIVLFRDPRDVIVSQYFQKTKRSSRTKDTLECDIGSFIKHGRFGIYTVIKTMNNWFKRLNNHSSCHWISYENMKNDTAKELKAILHFIGLKDIDDQIAEQAVAFSDFKNMKKMESSGDFDKSILRPVDRDDPNSYKVRAGKIGGYVDYFSESDLHYLKRALGTLNRFFGYLNH